MSWSNPQSPIQIWKFFVIPGVTMTQKIFKKFVDCVPFRNINPKNHFISTLTIQYDRKGPNQLRNLSKSTRAARFILTNPILNRESGSKLAAGHNKESIENLSGKLDSKLKVMQRESNDRAENKEQDIKSIQLNKIRVFRKGKSVEFEFQIEKRPSTSMTLMSINSNDSNYSNVTLSNDSQNDSSVSNIQIEKYVISAEVLRVYSASANMLRNTTEQFVSEDGSIIEEQHSERKLLYGKHNVTIEDIVPLGHYAIQISFSDGHKQGIYSFGFLRDLGKYQSQYIRHYLRTLQDNGVSRRGRITRINKAT